MGHFFETLIAVGFFCFAFFCSIDVAQAQEASVDETASWLEEHLPSSINSLIMIPGFIEVTQQELSYSHYGCFLKVSWSSHSLFEVTEKNSDSAIRLFLPHERETISLVARTGESFFIKNEQKPRAISINLHDIDLGSLQVISADPTSIDMYDVTKTGVRGDTKRLVLAFDDATLAYRALRALEHYADLCFATRDSF